jgi:hypothetical protein
MHGAVYRRIPFIISTYKNIRKEKKPASLASYLDRELLL